MTTKEEILTTEKGCFNCSRFVGCPHIASEKRKGTDFKEILEEDGESFVFGCACSSYDYKEKVQFT